MPCPYCVQFLQIINLPLYILQNVFLVDEEAAEPVVKAAKKAKKSQPVSEDVADIASVGDANLVRSGKKIIKALYTEHKEVAAMSEDKVIAL